MAVLRERPHAYRFICRAPCQPQRRHRTTVGPSDSRQVVGPVRVVRGDRRQARTAASDISRLGWALRFGLVGSLQWLYASDQKGDVVVALRVPELLQEVVAGLLCGVMRW